MNPMGEAAVARSSNTGEKGIYPFIPKGKLFGAAMLSKMNVFSTIKLSSRQSL